MDGFLHAVQHELNKQDAKWGEQNHQNGTGPTTLILSNTDVNLDLRTGRELEKIFREKAGRLAAGTDPGVLWQPLTWRDILLEEVFEALAECNLARLSDELIQVAAVAVQWRKAIIRARYGEQR